MRVLVGDIILIIELKLQEMREQRKGIVRLLLDYLTLIM